MAKIDLQLEAIEAGFQNPEVRYGTTFVPDAQMEPLGLRRKKAGQEQHRVCYLSIGETGQAPTATFWGHKFTDVLIKALEWRQLPTKSKRGPKAAATAQ
jgi:hypothetical protein